MTPSARLAAVLELLTEIVTQDRPADLVAGTYLRARRYIGAKDRKAISDRLWGILRRRARLDWWLARLDCQSSPRGWLLADLALFENLPPESVAELFAGERGIGTLAPQDWALLQALKGRDPFHHEMPAWVRGEYPAWLEPRLAALFGERLPMEMGALRDEAPVDLRVNTLKATDRAAVQAALAAEGLEAQPTPLSPLGLRLPARVSLTVQAVFRDGLVEVQDEGSQLLALLTDARPGQAVVDFCAGAGGKTLALAASMQNKGRLVACDVNERRAERAVLRLRRAGVHNVTRRLLESEHDKWIKRQSGTFDRVLVDAPCSGSGTWRRNPDAKWRLSAAGLEDLLAVQGRILDSASRLTRPGGRLIYATCSLLAEENEERIATFLAAHEEFSPLPLADLWPELIGGPCPLPGPFLRLSPASQGTDGFFAAVLERRALA